MLDLTPNESAAGTLHKRFLDVGFPSKLSSAAFASFKRDAHPPEAVASGLSSWQHRSLDEYRSMLAFSELLLNMTEAQLPFDLIGTCVRVVRDEARHVELCRRMVRALGGDGVMPGEPNWVRAEASQTPQRRVLQTVLASLCIGETFSARLLAAACDTTVDPLARAANQCFAADEAIHSLFGWTTLEYLLANLSDAERREATSIAEAALTGCETAILGDTDPRPPHPFGHIPADRVAQVFHRTRAEIQRRLERFGLGASAPAAQGRIPPSLSLCRACNQHVTADAETCPHCGASIAQAQNTYRAKMERTAEVQRRANALLRQLGMLPK